MKDWAIRRHSSSSEKVSTTTNGYPEKDKGIVYSVCKYCESSGRKVLTPERTYSKERKAEFKLRDWLDLNSMGEM